jgi:hypothetical protein
MSRFFMRALLAAVVVIATLSSAPAAQADQADPGAGGGCEAWAHDFYKSGTTVIGKLTVSCTKTPRAIRVAGTLYRSGKQSYKYRDCHKVRTCTLILGLKDIKGAQRYTLAFDGTHNATHVYWGSLTWSDHVTTTGQELRVAGETRTRVL